MLADDVLGTASFLEARYEGNASVITSTAVVKAAGPMEAAAEGTDIAVTIYEYNRKGVTTPGIDYGWRAGFITDKRERVHDYDEASIRIAGQPDGLFLLWPNVEGEDTDIALDLNPKRAPRIFASPTTEVFYSDDQRYVDYLEAPVFGLGHHNDRYADVQLGNASFDALRAKGGLTLIVQDADLTIEHAAGNDTFRTGTERSRFETVPNVRDRHVVYAAITIRNGSADLDFDGLDATVLTHDPTWKINGTLDFRAKKGNLTTGAENRTLDYDMVRLVGNTTFHLASDGPSDGTTAVNRITVPSNPKMDQTDVDAVIRSDAEEVYVNGDRLEVSATPPAAVPEEVFLLTKLLGIVLLAWAVLNKLVFALINLFARNSLDHPRRRKIYDLLTEQRMAHHCEIHRATGIPTGSLAYHLRMLREAGLVGKVRQGGYSVYFPLHGDRSWDEMRCLALLANPTRQRIAETLVNDGAQTQDSLQERLGLMQPSISEQLAQLVNKGLVEQRGKRDIKYTATSLLHAWVEGD